MTAPGTPSDAAALGQLPEDIELAADEVMGIDVSSHQRDIDWQQVAADGYSFAYLKATEGSNFTDDRFQEKWDGAKAAGRSEERRVGKEGRCWYEVYQY